MSKTSVSIKALEESDACVICKKEDHRSLWILGFDSIWKVKTRYCPNGHNICTDCKNRKHPKTSQCIICKRMKYMCCVSKTTDICDHCYNCC